MKKSNFRYMINDAKRYIPLLKDVVYKDSIYEVKTVQVKWNRWWKTNIIYKKIMKKKLLKYYGGK